MLAAQAALQAQADAAAATAAQANNSTSSREKLSTQDATKDTLDAVSTGGNGLNSGQKKEIGGNSQIKKSELLPQADDVEEIPCEEVPAKPERDI